MRLIDLSIGQLFAFVRTRVPMRVKSVTAEMITVECVSTRQVINYSTGCPIVMNRVMKLADV